jgi:Na+-transporting NADH:ubiquinone oxidoreductase subunit C
MNTNSNLYTVIYTTLIVVVVAALLAFVSQSLKGRQEANEKAETISQMLTAAQLGSKAEFQKMGNQAVLAKYAEEIAEAYTVGLDGAKVADLPLDQVFSPKELKRQNYNIKGGANATGDAEIPVFVLKDGTTVVPIYGAGLWGPIWGYVAFEKGTSTIKGVYFDHESETAGLGAKIKDDPAFQASFQSKTAAFGSSRIFEIKKGADGQLEDNQIDAISGATMTSQGLDRALNTWLEAYSAYFLGSAPAADCCKHKHEGCGMHEGCEHQHEACEGKHEGCEHQHEACEGKHEGCEHQHEACEGKHEGCEHQHEACEGGHDQCDGNCEHHKAMED